MGKRPVNIEGFDTPTNKVTFTAPSSDSVKDIVHIQEKPMRGFYRLINNKLIEHLERMEKESNAEIAILETQTDGHHIRITLSGGGHIQLKLTDTIVEFLLRELKIIKGEYWVRVEDRFPPAGVEILANDQTEDDIYLVRYSGTKGWLNEFGQTDSLLPQSFTHWMHLPGTPKDN